MVSTEWKKFKDKYEQRCGEGSSVVLDYIAVFDILHFAVTGLSNEEIAYLVDEQVDYVRGVLLEFLGIEGFEVNLDFSPYDSYLDITDADSGHPFYIPPYYDICNKFHNIKQQVDEFYEKG